jgi:hypothetical protein
MLSPNQAFFFAGLILFGLSAAGAQQQAPVSTTACNNGNRGVVSCPTYTAPATTAVPGATMGGSMVVNAGTTTLFNGVVPPNGFMVQVDVNTDLCYVSDNLPANGQYSPTPEGFKLGGIWIETPQPGMFVTPPGYKPMGPVSIWCAGGHYITVRGL